MCRKFRKQVKATSVVYVFFLADRQCSSLLVFVFNLSDSMSKQSSIKHFHYVALNAALARGISVGLLL